jgi:hypothetical protein
MEEMGARRVYHVTPDKESGHWRVELEKAQRASSLHENKTEAVAAARGYAQNNRPAQVVVHKKDGSIQREYTYEDDPHPPRG